MGKSKMRNLVIDNNGTSENWKWIITNSKIIVQKENGKKQFLDNPNAERDRDCYTPITPGMVAEYIRTKILGLEPKVVEVKPKVNPVVEPKVITKSKIYIVMKKVYYIDPEYGSRTFDEFENEYWIDPTKAKIRAEELNQAARNLYIYDELCDNSNWWSKDKDLIKLVEKTTYQHVDNFSETKRYKDIVSNIEEYNLGYEFRAVEKTLNL